MARTGIVELDRVVEAHNRHARRLAESRAEAAALAAKASQMDRLGALGRMAAGLAHEIRNPVAAMRLKVENALAGPPARQEAALQTILGHIGRIDRLVGEMLAFAQPIALHPQTVPLAEFVHERVELLHERAEAAGVALSGAAGQGSCSFDPEHMARAVDNLLINGLQHTPAGGQVTLDAALEGERLRLAVSDSGPGIAPEMAARLFEPFSTSRAEGTGLGLSIAREIAVAHGGTLSLQPSNRGALFVIELPCRPS
jgi:signal transduction histidine kinase